ncbi:uncharacterized protein N7477_006182, partial [Penicillium maclennaniae]|uniref:uncharacterized protein n=1 Tax=Penicillium maclennaniae TaxID=1343394 RepID=UPI002541C380
LVKRWVKIQAGPAGLFSASPELVRHLDCPAFRISHLPFHSTPSYTLNHLTASPTMASIRANCRKIMCIGRNYACGVSVHYEVELGLVIGKTVRDLDPQDEQGALDAIQSYILAIDMTGRNVQDEAKKKGLPWSIAKGFDTFLPISQEIAKSRIPNPHDAFLRLHVGKNERQADSTSLMLYRIPQQLAHISRIMTLEKGDIVLTGTPKGVGQVHAGDVMRATIEVGGKEIEEGRIEVEVQDREGPYEFKET